MNQKQSSYGKGDRCQRDEPMRPLDHEPEAISVHPGTLRFRKIPATTTPKPDDNRGNPWVLDSISEAARGGRLMPSPTSLPLAFLEARA